MADTSTQDWKLLYEAGRQALQLRKLQEAEQSFSAALQLAEDFPAGDPRLAATLNALARIYSLQHRYLAAAALLNRLLEVTERTLGPSHVQVAGVLTNLAEMYTHLGATREELELRERVLAIRAGDANADATAVQRLRERVTELRSLIASQEPAREHDDDHAEMELLPSVVVSEHSASIPHPEEPASTPEPEPVMPLPRTADTGRSAANAEAQPRSPAPLVARPERVPRVSIPNQAALSMVGTAHHATDEFSSTLALPAGRKSTGWSNLYSIAAGVLLVAGVLAARSYVATPDDGRVSAASVNVANGAAAASAPPAAPVEAAAEPRTVEHLVAERRRERDESRAPSDEEVAREADRSLSTARSVAPRPPRELERALRGVDGAVRAIDQRARAAADSAMAIRVEAPTFKKVRIADP